MSTTWPSTAEIVPFPAPNGAHAPLGLNGATHTTAPPPVGDNKPTFQDNAEAVVRIGTIITSFKRIGLAIRDRRCQRPHLLVLYAFMEKLNQGTGTAFPSRRAIAEQEGLRYEAVENALYELRRWGYIDWEKRAEPDLHKGKLLHYTLPVLTWTDQELTNAILALRASQRAQGPRPAEYTSRDVHSLGCTPPRVTKSTPQGVTRNLLKRELEERGADAPPAAKGGDARRGMRLPEDWALPEGWRAHPRQRGLSEQQIAAVARKFHGHWTTVPGQKALKLNWERVWESWVDNEIDKYGLKPAGAAQVQHSSEDAWVSEQMRSPKGIERAKSMDREAHEQMLREAYRQTMKCVRT